MWHAYPGREQIFMIREIIHASNGGKIVLTISDDGYCYCPVCGEKSKDKDWRPYDSGGNPSYDICSCGFEYGFDDAGGPLYEKSWDTYRQKWVNGEIEQVFGKRLNRGEKLEQLKNLGL